MDEKKTNKSVHSEREEKILDFWRENQIFEKTLEKNKNKGKNFVFFEGPPTANGKPGIHHLEARAFKDAIPRYKTMCGYYVRRKGGWDTHGLPVELQVEKELGLKSKKEIEKYGIAPFNEKCKESVWKYVHEWEAFTDRIGYWVDLKDPYITYKPKYIESVWNIIKEVDKQKLIYKDYKVVPWCPRCGTALSSHELAQGYEDVKDLSVYVKFKVKNPEKIGLKGDVYLLAWTTTPWTLPGNVALAVGENIDYVSINYNPPANAVFEPSLVKNGEEVQKSYISKGVYIIAKDILWKSLNEDSELRKMKRLFDSISVDLLSDLVEFASNQAGFFTKYSDHTRTHRGKDLIGLEYEPLYPFIVDNISGAEKDKLQNAYKVYPADFVTTTDGTGIVHTAVMYGQDDFELGTKVGLPKYHLVNEDGTFKPETGYLAGAFVKDPATDVAIIKDLAGRGSLFAKEKYEHSYPHCWRCHTSLIYYARDSWYIAMSKLRDKLVEENKDIHWEPEHIKEGRFGEWLSQIKDWAISRERYWGTPLPIWVCNNEKCGKRKVVGSKVELENKSSNTYFIMRHGQSENNVKEILNSDIKNVFHLTEKGRNDVQKTTETIKEKFDVIISSPLQRTKETAEIVAKATGYKVSDIILDNRLLEVGFGELEGASEDSYAKLFSNRKDFFNFVSKGVESRQIIKKRSLDLLQELESKYKGKKILLVGHSSPLWLMTAVANGLDLDETLTIKPRGEIFMKNAELRPLEYKVIPRNEYGELDLHRPFIDEVYFDCSCGGKMQRVKEVMDVWFDSGSMPFAQDHYPFENKELIDSVSYPADYISEAIDQTRGWFYTLHAIGVLMGKGKAYRNVICLGHILDEKGKKMSKSIGNVVNPQEMMDKYCADALRFWMYSVNQPGDSKNFDEKTVDEVVKKVFNLITNVLSFYKLYDSGKNSKDARPKSQHVLDRWIMMKTDELIIKVTKGLDNYVFLEPTRSIREFIADLSQWYLRRSRDRFKTEGEDKEQVLITMKYVLTTLAKVMAPFTPFLSEYVYREIRGKLESVHLEDWPVAETVDAQLLQDMETVRILASKGLEARMKAGINVRQPLMSLKLKNSVVVGLGKLSNEFLEIIKDEVNVKEVLFDDSINGDVELDTNITPELKEEGMVREVIRAIQDLRKEAGLTVNDRVVLIVGTNEEGNNFVEKNKAEIMRVTLLKEIKFENQSQDISNNNIEIGDLKMKLGFNKE